MAEILRKTSETDISVFLDFQGSGKADISSGIPFFDHMLTAMAKHGRFDLRIRARGDLAVDPHHTVEDTAIVLGEAIRAAIGEGRGIRRFSHAIVPMDESLATVAMDCSGRGYLVFQGCFSHKTLGGIEQDIFEHFFHTLCSRAGLNVHIVFHGKNDHHQAEALFKAFGIALGEAVAVIPGRTDIPSTKGVL